MLSFAMLQVKLDVHAYAAEARGMVAAFAHAGQQGREQEREREQEQNSSAALQMLLSLVEA